jgi:hypothetical protein
MDAHETSKHGDELKELIVINPGDISNDWFHPVNLYCYCVIKEIKMSI